MGSRVGMHMHSRFSDGMDSPRVLVNKIVEAGLGGACLSDHDTIEGLTEFQAFADRFGIETISGVEVSAHWRNRTFVHILGYGIDHIGKYDMLRKKLTKNINAHRGLFYKIMRAAARKFSVSFSEEMISRKTSQFGPVSFGLPTLRFLESHLGLPMDGFNKAVFGKTPSFAEAIIEGDFLSVEEAIELIQSAGGKAVLAHPGLFRIYTVRGDSKKQDFEDLLSDLVKMGLSGIEAFYPDHSESETEYFNILATQYGLWRTAGSDYHGNYIPGRSLSMSGIHISDFMEFKRFCEK
jgi:predicted metal-dependent phosphoesterase TrpH